METQQPDETLDEIDERPQRRREWSGPLRSIVLPLIAVLVIVAVVWYLQAGRGSAATPSQGFGVLSLPAARNVTSKPPAPTVGRAAPDFRLETLDGSSVRLSDFQGKLVLINFWASWCPPCRQEMPGIVQAYNQNKDRGFVVLSVDEQEDNGTVQRFADQFAMDFPIALDVTGQVGKAFRAGTQFPTSVWVDQRGIVQEVKYGPMDDAFLAQKLSGLPAAPTPAAR